MSSREKQDKQSYNCQGALVPRDLENMGLEMNPLAWQRTAVTDSYRQLSEVLILFFREKSFFNPWNLSCATELQDGRVVWSGPVSLGRGDPANRRWSTFSVSIHTLLHLHLIAGSHGSWTQLLSEIKTIPQQCPLFAISLFMFFIIKSQLLSANIKWKVVEMMLISFKWYTVLNSMMKSHSILSTFIPVSTECAALALVIQVVRTTMYCASRLMFQ